MFEKQDWKLLSNPDAIVSKIFKAKYFPNGDFLLAQLGHNLNFTWCSIWYSLSVLEKGCQWKIRTCCGIGVWKDPWLRDPNNFWVETMMNPGLCVLKVNDLIILECREWEHKLLEELFKLRDALEISSILLTLHPLADH